MTDHTLKTKIPVAFELSPPIWQEKQPLLEHDFVKKSLSDIRMDELAEKTKATSTVTGQDGSSNLKEQKRSQKKKPATSSAGLTRTSSKCRQGGRDKHDMYRYSAWNRYVNHQVHGDILRSQDAYKPHCPNERQSIIKTGPTVKADVESRKGLDLLKLRRLCSKEKLISPKTQPHSSNSDFGDLRLPPPACPVTHRSSAETEWPGKLDMDWFSKESRAELYGLGRQRLRQKAYGSMEICSPRNQVCACPSPSWEREQPSPLWETRSQDSSSQSSLVTQRPPGLSPIDQARLNCQNTFAVIRALGCLVDDLLTQQNASGCDMVVEDTSCYNDAYIVERMLHVRGAIDTSPHGLHRVRRACDWFCERIVEEVRMLQVLRTQVVTESEQGEYSTKFIKKWKSRSDELLDGIAFQYQGRENLSDDYMADLVKNDIQENVVAYTVEFWRLFQHREHQYRNEQDLIRKDSGKEKQRGTSSDGAKRDKNYQKKRIQELDDSQRLVGLDLDCIASSQSLYIRNARRRCYRNIQSLQAFFSAFCQELEEEIERRHVCRHSPMCCRYKGLTSTLIAARDVLEARYFRLEDLLPRARQLFQRTEACELDGCKIANDEDQEFVRQWGDMRVIGFPHLLSSKGQQVLDSFLENVKTEEVRRPNRGKRANFPLPIDDSI